MFDPYHYPYHKRTKPYQHSLPRYELPTLTMNGPRSVATHFTNLLILRNFHVRKIKQV